MLDASLATDMAAASGVVFAAVPNAVLVGPLTHVTLFVNGPTHDVLAGVPLPEAKYRYLISCLPCESHRSTPGSLVAEAGAKDAATTHAASMDAQTLMTLAKQRAASFMARQPKPIEQRPQPVSSNPAFSSAESLSETSSRRTSSGLRCSAMHEQADYVTAMAQKVLGASQLWSCAIAGDELVTPAVLATLKRIDEVRTATPQSVFYVYSSSGRNRASALALLYLVRNCNYSLQAATTTLPLSTPALPYLRALIREDEQRGTQGEQRDAFDMTAYLPAYFARRYPHVALTAIRTALDAFPQDYTTVDRVLCQHHLMHHPRPPSPSTTAAALSLTTTGETVLSSPSSLSASISGALSTRSTETPVALSTSSRVNGAGGNKDGATMNALDEEAVATLCKALSLAQIGASYDEVKESYLRHHRRTQLVLREFFAQRSTALGAERGAVASSTPPLTSPTSTTPTRLCAATQGIVTDHSRSPTPRVPGTSV